MLDNADSEHEVAPLPAASHEQTSPLVEEPENEDFFDLDEFDDFGEYHHQELGSSVRSEVLLDDVGQRNISFPIARAQKPVEWTSDAPLFRVPAWTPLGCQMLPPREMARHTLITGETGSGKTKSGIFPLVEAALHYPGPAGPPNLIPSILIIDPKHEIADFVARNCEQTGLDRTVVQFDPDVDSHTLWFFEGSDPQSITAEEYVHRILGVSGALQTENDNGNSLFFRLQAEGMLRQLVAVDMYVSRTFGYHVLSRFWQTVRVNVNEQLAQGNDQMIAFEEANYLAAHYSLANCAAATASVAASSKQTGSAALLGYVDAAVFFGAPASLLLGIRSLAALPWETLSAIIATVNNVLSDLSAPELARSVSLNPFVMPPVSRWLSVSNALNAGHVVIHHPRDSSRLATIVGKCLKTKFFEWTFTRPNQERPFVYVCDEFQRYITNDSTSGEQSFLDRCRAYRASCVLATQSMASLSFALAQDRAGGHAADGAALEILLNNTGNKLFFRNTDLSTQDRLRALLPAPSKQGKLHVTAVRPVSTLGVGEAYFLLSTGAWGRRQIRLSV